jgi:lipopolysaccharide export system permease protein
MKIIERYIALHTIGGVLVVLTLFAILFSFMELLSQINDVGKGNYGLSDAFIFVAATLPKRIVDLLPICILLGSIIALGVLADRLELVAMQASGISAQRISWSVLVAGAVLTVAAFMLAEFVAPPLDQRARIGRSHAIYGKGIMMTKGGFWTRHGNAFIHVGNTLSNKSVADVNIFEHDDQGRLQHFLHARQGSFQEHDQWQLAEVEQKTFSELGIKAITKPLHTIEGFLSAEQVGILELPPDSLSLTDLYGYVRGLKERGQNADRYALSFWQKISLPLTNLAMMLVALTFIFGYRRDITAGRRIILATTVGIVLYLLNQIIGHLGLLLDLHPALTTLGPVLIIFGLSVWLLSRLR